MLGELGAWNAFLLTVFSTWRHLSMQNPHCNLTSGLINSYTRFSELCNLWLGSFLFPNAVLYISLMCSIQAGSVLYCFPQSTEIASLQGGKAALAGLTAFPPQLPTHPCVHGTDESQVLYQQGNQWERSYRALSSGLSAHLSVHSYAQIPQSQSSWRSNYYSSILPWVAITSIISFFLQYFP